MNYKEYYEFPEGTVCGRKVYKAVDDINAFGVGELTGSWIYLMGNSNGMYALPDIVGSPTAIEYGFYSCGYAVSLKGLENVDTSKCTNFTSLFNGFGGYIKTFMSTNIPLDTSPIKNWNTSNVTNMSSCFNGAKELVDFDVNWDTSKVTDMNTMFAGCTELKRICPLRADSLAFSQYAGLFGSSTMNNLTEFGGLINLKSSWTGSNYALNKCPNLTYESCINILNGLYDFTGNGETPNSNQGKLKVHQNFLNLVGDEISIGTNKGWTITV